MSDARYRCWNGETMEYGEFDINASTGRTKDGKQVMPFTTLRDRNGKAIYKSDILKIDKDFAAAIACDMEHVLVDFNIGCWMFGRRSEHPKGTKYPDMMDTYLWLGTEGGNLEVAGNLYETPELITFPDENKQTCEHGKGLTDYCEPCGRVNGGG